MVGGRASDQMEKLDYFQKATARYIFHKYLALDPLLLSACKLEQLM